MGLGAWGMRDCRGRRWMDGLEREMALMSVVGVGRNHYLLRDSQKDIGQPTSLFVWTHKFFEVFSDEVQNC